MSTATDRKAGYSSDCRGSNHVLCQRSGARCVCVCHGVTAPKATPKVRARRGPRLPVYVEPVLVRPSITKEQAPCCVSRRDSLGRLPVGFCSPGCVRRPS